MQCHIAITEPTHKSLSILLHARSSPYVATELPANLPLRKLVPIHHDADVPGSVGCDRNSSRPVSERMSGVGMKLTRMLDLKAHGSGSANFLRRARFSVWWRARCPQVSCSASLGFTRARSSRFGRLSYFKLAIVAFAHVFSTPRLTLLFSAGFALGRILYCWRRRLRL